MRTSSGLRRRVLMVGLDAAELGLIDRWTADGSLPHLARLRRDGAFGPMGSTAELNASPWPSFITGVHPGDHGYHNFLMWNPRTMRHERPTARWPSDMTPFWRDLSRHGPRVVVLDVPDTFPGEDFNGMELGNWASHYRMCPSYALPAGRMKEIERRFGTDPMPLERAGLTTVDELLGIRDRLIDVADRQTRLAEAMLESEAWDLFLLVYGSTHRGGHHLWSDTGVAGEVPAERRDEFDRALFEIYAACDRGLGRILQGADDDTLVLVFACHGMTDNRMLADLLPEMLRRVVHGDDGGGDGTRRDGERGLAQRLRDILPLSWRGAVKDRLPQSWQDRLTVYWRAGGEDWGSTPVFCTMADLQGHIRVNLVGRERDGIVEPGDDYERWLEKVVDGLMTWVDERTGEPVVAEIRRPEELYPDGAMNRFLPDLVVYWPQRPAARFEAMVSERYGRIASPFGHRAPDGRSGHHDFDGWLLARGPGIAPGTALRNVNALDLPPTLHALFDVPVPPRFRGTPIPTLLRSGQATT